MEENLGLCRRVAGWYPQRVGSLVYEDLVQAGTLGLIRAAEKWDGVRDFARYAMKWILAHVRRAIHWEAHMVRVPAWRYGTAAGATLAREQAEALAPASMTAWDDDREMPALVGDADRVDARLDLQVFMASLTTLQCEAIRRRFLDGDDVEQIAQERGVTRGAVRNHIRKGLAMLRQQTQEVR